MPCEPRRDAASGLLHDRQPGGVSRTARCGAAARSGRRQRLPPSEEDALLTGTPCRQSSSSLTAIITRISDRRSSVRGRIGEERALLGARSGPRSLLSRVWRGERYRLAVGRDQSYNKSV